MIVSFNPIYTADINLNCAGRPPCANDLIAIKNAKAVILPQGCSRALYEMACTNCRHVFPLAKPRYAYPGKVGQSRFFSTAGVDHPITLAFENLAEFQLKGGSPFLPFPFVFKLNLGGEGENVFFIHSPEQFQQALQTAQKFESSGQNGFILQQLVPCRNRCLRVVIIGRRLISYWRRMETGSARQVNLRQGAIIDHSSAPALQAAGRRAVSRLCARHGIDLAGFDLIFSDDELACGRIRPLFLEINYFFGRRGLGGSENYYRILTAEIDAWLERLGLVCGVKSRLQK